jgi:dTDP-4-amino-4,6-dideoxygalactose transaminase
MYTVCEKGLDMIPFNKPYFTGKETRYIEEAVFSGKISGNGAFTKKCQEFFERKYGFGRCLLTTSCTDALEMCAILADVGPGDEVIAPSYTFVTTALAFVRQGAKIVFADSCGGHPNIDAGGIEALVTPRTKAVVAMHYAGMACDMGEIARVAAKHNLLVIEDAAQAVDSYYVNGGNAAALGSIGRLSAFSFHETKNIISGEGGMLAVNDERFFRRAEIIWEKGTNRAEFFRGEVNKYGWVDTGSSFLPSEVTAAFLWAQIECLDAIQAKRKRIWDAYFEGLKPLADKGCFSLPEIPGYATNNAHMFYIVCNSREERDALIEHLKGSGVSAVFHYLCLHRSEFYRGRHDGRELKNADRFADCLLRLPFFYELTQQDVEYVCGAASAYSNG